MKYRFSSVSKLEARALKIITFFFSILPFFLKPLLVIAKNWGCWSAILLLSESLKLRFCSWGIRWFDSTLLLLSLTSPGLN